MPTPEEVVAEIAAAAAWDQRVALIRRIPESFGTGQHGQLYAAVAQEVYVPHLAPDFAYVPWRDEYELAPMEHAYALADAATGGFTDVRPARLSQCLLDHPETLAVFRNIVGFIRPEFAAATKRVTASLGLPGLTLARVKSMERGVSQSAERCACTAELIHRVMTGDLFTSPTENTRRKQAKPDTADGWDSVRHFARRGVPYAMFLHQRHYGGAFRQLLDATSQQRGNVLEDAVEELFDRAEIQYIRTGSANQAEIERRFGLTVRPAPDFVVYSAGDTLRALLECKGANDGGTARDKAARFRTLRTEGTRLGGVPLFAVLAGLGWDRTSDALGPVVRDCDGRVFTLPTLPELLTVQPFPGLVVP